MMIIRPIKPADLIDLKNMAVNAGIGFTSLPANEELLKQRIEAAEQAFLAADDSTSNQSYLFVLEDTDNGHICGVCGIESALGQDTPWYNYHLGTLVHASPSLNVYGKSRTLTLSNDHTDCSELCTLFLDANYRHSKNGSLLSKSRFLFIANQPQRFNRRIIAEMRGVSDEQGNSPFWDGLGAHFFAMPFSRADYLSGLGNKAFIAELMPKLPIYTNLLKESVQEVIGQVHQNTAPALNMLEQEGFANLGYVDIFDGGPTIEADIRHIRAITQSKSIKVTVASTGNTADVTDESSIYVISNQSLNDYRCTLITLTKQQANAANLVISPEYASALKVAQGDKLRLVPLKADGNSEY
ncbi:MAG: arginine N-succinyltransferase [Oceanospirillaceae bacterium]|jgi:arginine N-succinyltransferase